MNMVALLLTIQFTANATTMIKEPSSAYGLAIVMKDGKHLCELSPVVWATLQREDPVLQFFDRVQQRAAKKATKYYDCNFCDYEKAIHEEYTEYVAILIEPTCHLQGFHQYSARDFINNLHST